MKLSTNMQFLKKERNLTFKELESETKISTSVLYRYANGKVKGLETNLKNIESIAKALQTNPILLIGWDEHIPNSNSSYSENSDFRSLQKALNEIDQLSNTNKELFFAGGFDLKKMTMEEVIERAEAIKIVLHKIKEVTFEDEIFR